jgi:hypothetical protein
MGKTFLALVVIVGLLFVAFVVLSAIQQVLSIPAVVEGLKLFS